MRAGWVQWAVEASSVPGACGHCKKAPQSKSLKPTDIYFLTIMEVKDQNQGHWLTSRSLQGGLLLEALEETHSWHFQHLMSTCTPWPVVPSSTFKEHLSSSASFMALSSSLIGTLLSLL